MKNLLKFVKKQDIINLFNSVQRKEVSMAKKRRSNRKVHRGRRKKRGFSTWSLGKKIGVIAVSILLVLVIGGGAAAAGRKCHYFGRRGR